MFLNYSEIEKINFNDQKIDHEFNLRIFKTFEKFYLKAKNENVDFILTGSLGTCLYYNKIYRTIKDIDILISFKDIKVWFEIFKSSDYSFHKPNLLNKKNKLKYIRNFVLNKIKSITFLDQENKCKIEIISIYDKNDLNNLIKNEIIFKNSNAIKIKNPIMVFEKFKLNFSREKDLVDWNFLNQYLKT